MTPVTPSPHLRATTRERLETFSRALSDRADAPSSLTGPQRAVLAAAALRAAGHDAGEPADRQSWDGALAALVAHVEQVAADPRRCGPAAIRIVADAGATPAQVVGASQVATFAIFQARLHLVGAALDAVLAQEVPPESPTPEAHPGADLAHPREEFPLLGWRAWVRPVDEAAVPTKDDAKGASDYYRVLVHEPVLLDLRTSLYDEVMTGEGELDRADRELVALATSLTTGCTFCATVHGRRHFFLSKDTVSTPLLKHHGVAALPTARERALAQLGSAVASTPTSLRPGHVAALLAEGLTPEQVMDAGAVAAMFTWANRLMLTLGQGVRQGKVSVEIPGRPTRPA